MENYSQDKIVEELIELSKKKIDEIELKKYTEKNWGKIYNDYIGEISDEDMENEVQHTPLEELLEGQDLENYLASCEYSKVRVQVVHFIRSIFYRLDEKSSEYLVNIYKAWRAVEERVKFEPGSGLVIRRPQIVLDGIRIIFEYDEQGSRLIIDDKERGLNLRAESEADYDLLIDYWKNLV